MKLKRARLADDLNEKIALRPGPLELVEKNIIPVDSAVKEAIKGSGSERAFCVVCMARGRGWRGYKDVHQCLPGVRSSSCTLFKFPYFHSKQSSLAQPYLGP